ncbi:hypothetical protein ACFLUZ_01680 [Chloroflexota bacterium]
MKEWKKVTFFADGVIYACGNKRKIVTSGNTAVYYELKGQDVRWYQNPSDGKRLDYLRKNK